MRGIIAALVMAALIALPGAACADTAIGIVTGPKTGTYFAFGKNIAQIAAKDGIRVDVKPSEGSVDNIKRIDSSENAALGIVQSDVMGFLSRSRNPESMHIAGNLRMVFPLYSEEVHILARRGIRSFSDLQDKKVAIGEEGSGSMLTAINLFSMMNVAPAESVKISPAEGVVGVLKGDLDAMVFVGGKPVRLFKNLEDLRMPQNQKYESMLDEVHFLPLDDPKMLEEYKPAEITHGDYSFVAASVPTIAVQSVLISYDFARGKNRCDAMAKLARTIRAALPWLKEHGHPKWKEVNLDAGAGEWKKDACVWPASTTGGAHDQSQKDLLNILEKKKR